MTVMPVEHARALVLLAEGKTAREAADDTGQPLGRIVQLARRQGWTIHPATQLATAPLEEDDELLLPADVVEIAAAWTGPQTPAVPAVDDEDASVDDLLDDARECDDRRVQAALAKAETAIEKLRGVYEEAAARIAEEQAAERARAAALAEIAELKAKLALAEQKAAEAGAKVRKTPAKPKSGEASKIREWAREHGIDVPERGRIPGPVLNQYNGSQAVAS